MSNRNFLLILSVVCLGCIGCGGGNSGSVSGTAEYEGKPLPGGRVVFESKTSTCVAKIENGKFEAKYKGSKSLPMGTYKVSVWPPAPEPKMNPKTMKLETVSSVDTSLYPKKYQSKLTSGLEFTLVPGSNVFDIELSGKK